MPTLETHVTLASGAALGLATNMLGLDYAAMFWAFMGALAWRAVQPKIDPTLSEISAAFGWATMATFLGSLGAGWIEISVQHYFEFFREFEHVSMIGLPSLLLGFMGNPLLLKVVELIKNYKRGAP